MDVVEMMLQGMSNQEISSATGYSIDYVELEIKSFAEDVARENRDEVVFSEKQITAIKTLIVDTLYDRTAKNITELSDAIIKNIDKYYGHKSRAKEL